MQTALAHRRAPFLVTVNLKCTESLIFRVYYFKGKAEKLF